MMINALKLQWKIVKKKDISDDWCRVQGAGYVVKLTNHTTDTMQHATCTERYWQTKLF